MALQVQQSCGPKCSSCASGCGSAARQPRLEPSQLPRGGAAVQATVLLAGNPNAGKTTVFNALSGANARVGNYPGITVDRHSAMLTLDSGRTLELVDLPGTYSLTARSPEEQIAADAVLARSSAPPDAVVVVADATTLGRGLYFALQIIESGAPVVLALNMMDEAARSGVRIDTERLGQALGVTVVPMAAAKGQGRAELRNAIDRVLATEARREPRLLALAPQLEAEVAQLIDQVLATEAHPEPRLLALAPQLEAEVAQLTAAVALALPQLSPAVRRSWALWLLLSVGDDELTGIPPELRELALTIQARLRAQGIDPDLEIISARYAYIDSLITSVVRRTAPQRRSVTDRIDSVLTHPVQGFLVFGVVMLTLFEALFNGAEPAMDVIETGMAWAQRLVESWLAPSLLRELLVSGVIHGVGNVLVFVPQIALLFFFVTFLEDSGYLARVAFIIDPIMARLGLHGRAFVPLLSGFACAVPAVLATRTIETRRDRLITMLALPLMSCSARLPVYVLLIGTVFAGHGRLLGFISTGAAVLFAMYCLSVVATLGVAATLGRTALPGARPALVLELPPYRMPVPRNLLLAVVQRVRSFVREAGTVILAITIVLWAALTFPRSQQIEQHYASARVEAQHELQGAELHARMTALHGQQASDELAYTVGGRIGHAIEPVLAPLGFDWRIGVGLLGAFAAREVFVSTLGMVFGIEGADEGSAPLRTALRGAHRADGSRLMTPLTGVTLMVFFVLASQCMSTLAVVWREAGSFKWPALMFGYMSALAYVAAFLVRHAGMLFGWGLA